IFDAGIKKAARPNQYFALKAAQPRVKEKKGGIIWHSQGSGKSLTMIWLAKWIRREIGGNARVVIITDRDELDRQIENGFKSTDEKIERARSRKNLINFLNHDSPWLISTLVHKFGVKNDEDSIKVGDKKAELFIDDYIQQIERMLPNDYSPKGDFYVFIDECHRTHGGRLHEAMKKIMGDNVMLIGFTGTPLFKKDKKTSEQTFGSIIHSYKFNEAVKDKVILDLRYEARDIEQRLADENKFDNWFETKTEGLSEIAKRELKERWARLENIFSSRERIQRIVKDICYDMDMKPALKGGYGNALLVAGSIYQACRYYEEFEKTELKGHCALVTSYEPYGDNNPDDIRTDGDIEKAFKNSITKKLLGDRFNDINAYEQWAKKVFIEEPKRLKLMIVVDKLLTGFDAPSATYLYIDKQMRDHNLFQAICRVNRVDVEEKEYGYIIDYQDLFGAIKDSINTYTGGAFDNYDEKDIEGLLNDRLENAKKDLEDAINKVNYIIEPVIKKDQEGYFAYFVYKESTPVNEQEKEAEENAQKREKLYKAINNLVNRYIAIATEMTKAGYSEEEAREIKRKVDYYNNLK
ncbi:MAG TPA: restriction endonuclease subunit R, partial [Bacteroidales bacterium]|nr:restriction endonuclease subunit R [Bacteroidales bacterium]